MAVIEMTSTTLLKIGGALEQGPYLLHVGLQYETAPHQGGVDSVL
jgi:hypothetical protein